MEYRGRGHGRERHTTSRAGWLRAAVLGANDGLVSTASLMVGVTASAAGSSAIVTAGIAGVAAGSLAMAVGEYVSVSSQRDVEAADLVRERAEHAANPEAEHAELVAIYMERGLSRELSEEVTDALHRVDPIGAHLRDELGHNEHNAAAPVQAALASVISFVLGGLVPFVGLLVHGKGPRSLAIGGVTIVGLAIAGALGARAAQRPPLRPMLRVVFGGSVAIAVTAGIGALAHVSGL